ncbi:hypothetical protein PV326_010053, partial [Microctonus aethiopoides]
MHSTITSIAQPLNSNKNVLGIPVILPRTISSPELPSPIAELLEKESLPLVTLHNTTLGSPNTKSSPIKLIEMSYKAKKQTRSQSTLTLPHMELPGELAKVNDNFHNESNVNKIYKRSRSLSPCVSSSRCHCYNCNVSELIFQDLNPTERSNLRSYFDHCCGLPMNIDKRSFNRRRIITRRCSSENFKHNLTHSDFNKDKQQLQNKISSTSSLITRRMSCPEIVKSTESMLLGYNVSKKLTGSTNSLFSTAVISGSSSAPNLKDMIPPHASAVAAIEGFGGVPPIRPLETLHNALSLRQLDSFLEMMTSAPLFRTPASSPPKFPSPGASHPESLVPTLSIGGMVRNYHQTDLDPVRYISSTLQYKVGQENEGGDHRIPASPTSPTSIGWSSEQPSYLSSEPSSPAPTSAGESSMSMSLISSDG